VPVRREGRPLRPNERMSAQIATYHGGNCVGRIPGRSDRKQVSGFGFGGPPYDGENELEVRSETEGARMFQALRWQVISIAASQYRDDCMDWTTWHHASSNVRLNIGVPRFEESSEAAFCGSLLPRNN
jgi:hypothetical protein